MPMRHEDYPDNWKEISRAVREKARGRCMWCGATNGQSHPRTGSRVVLTVAHLGAPLPDSRYPWGNAHDKHDVRPCNLAALCQACHLGYDRDDHAKNAAETRRRRKVEAGQQAISAA